MSESDAPHDRDLGASPTRIGSAYLRQEAGRAFVWAAVVGLFVLVAYISQSLLVIFGAMVFGAMIDGGVRLLGRILPIGRGWRVTIVLLATMASLIWLGSFAGSQISREAAQLPDIVNQQLGQLFAWLRSQGVAISLSDVQGFASSISNGIGTLTRAIGGIVGGLTTLALIVIIGIYFAIDPNVYERGVAWMVPDRHRKAFYDTISHQAYTLRRLLAGRLLGMLIEGIFTYVMLAHVGQLIGIGPVPMAALLAILTGLLAFIPNIGAIISGVLMVLVGFSGGTEMGLYTVIVYLFVQNFDGYVLVPMIAKKTVDLAPALVLSAQLVFGVLFGIIGLALADPMLAMIKVGLERRAKRMEETEEKSPAEI